ncbi:hypothetical protein LTS17_006420 [Exophiala oligosperma]
MTKKKRHHPDVEEVLSRPWCYYCERDFDDLKILINHQKAKHFKCERCGRRLNTAGGLSVHMSQVHKENLTAVDNALPNRAGLDIEIFGMEGIPEDIVQQHTQRVLTNFHQSQAERQGAGGSGVPGGSNPNAPKKPKVESVSDIKKRLAEHKAAKLAAEKDNGGSSAGSTPSAAPPAQVQQPSQAQAPAVGFLFTQSSSTQKLIPVSKAGSPVYPSYQQSYAAPPTNGSYNQVPPFAQPPAVTASYQAPTYATAGSPPHGGGYGQAASPQPGQPGYGQVPPISYPAQPYAQPPPAGYPVQPAFSPPPYQYPVQPFPGQAGAPRPFGAGSPPPGFAQAPPGHLPQRAISPATNPNFPAPVRTGSVSLPSAPGLPQRPAFGAPPVSASQFHQMHQGQIPLPQAPHVVPQYPPQQPSVGVPHPPPQSQIPAPFNGDESLDDLIKGARDQADANGVSSSAAVSAITIPAPTAAPAPEAPSATAAAPAKEEAGEDKAAKKEKEKEKPKSTRLVYSDNDTSPEEKMAMLAKYAFTPAQKTIMV